MITLLEVLEALQLRRFVVYDVETTGLDPQTNDVIQVSLTRFIDGQKADSLNLFCEPHEEIPDFIQEMTRITPDLVAGQPAFSDRIPEMIDFIGADPMVGHNIRFDMGFLKAAYSGTIANELIDTLDLSRIFLYWLSERKLESLAEFYELGMEGAHRADVDTETTGKLLLKLLEEMQKYDYPLYQQLFQIIEPLINEPNYALIRRMLTLFERNGNTAKGSWTIHHAVSVNRYGNFQRTDDYYDDDDEPGHEPGDIQKVNSRGVKEIFDFQGKLSRKLPGYETRLGQIQLAEDIVEGFNRKRHIVAEAGTGVGKSLAYLIPAIKWVQRNRSGGYSAVISSNTKSLQEQLFFKDIPFVYENIDDDFTAVMLKGRANYICLTKWERLIHNLDRMISTFERPAILPLVLWLRETKTGDIEENIAFRSSNHTTVWSKVASEPGYCTSKKCAGHQGCYLGKVRGLAKVADIIVINHSLLLSDAVADNAILPNSPILIIDEAHHLQKSAYHYFAKEFAPWIADQTLEKLYRAGRDNFGTLVNLSRKAGGDKWEKSHLDLFIKRISRAEESVVNAQTLSRNFFQQFLNFVNTDIRKAVQKYTDKRRYTPDNNPFRGLEYTESLIRAFTELKNDLKAVANYYDELNPLEKQSLEETWTEFKNSVSEALELLGNIIYLLDCSDEGAVFWYEIPTDPRSTNILIIGTPLHVDEPIFERIIKTKHSVIATSATLAIGDSFDYFLSQTGFARVEHERLITRQYPSPFIYEEQAGAWVVTFLGEPTLPDFEANLAQLMNELAARYRKGTLLLTTSYVSIKRLRELMEPAYRREDIPLLTQAGNASRTALINRFKELGNATLIGTESFWEGVDVPGSALEILGMLKLPFGVPTEPIVQAISDELKAQGKNAFVEYSVPEAVLKFKQGFGRLIRSTTDTGIALFFDNRLSFKRYGQDFINSLPMKVGFVKSKEELFRNLDYHYHINKTHHQPLRKR